MAGLEVRGARVRFGGPGGFDAVAGVDLAVADGDGHGGPRPVGLREVDAPPGDRGPRAAGRRRRSRSPARTSPGSRSTGGGSA